MASNSNVSDMGLRGMAKHPCSDTKGHHDNCSPSAMTGIKTSVSDNESGRSHARPGAANVISKSSADGGAR